MDILNIPYLRTHSYYGFLDSLLSPEAIVELAIRNNLQTLGLTDFAFLSGAIEFYERCKSANIQPIIGLEIDCAFEGINGRLTLLAKDQNGWSNLSRLSTKLLVDHNPLDLIALRIHQEGLICIAGDHFGLLRQLLIDNSSKLNLPEIFIEHLQEIFQQDIFIEIQRFANNKLLKNENTLVDLARRHSIPIIATQSIHYENESDQSTFRTLRAIKNNASIQNLASNRLPPGSAHFPSQASFLSRYKDLPQAIENLIFLQERCQLDLPIGQMHYPEFPTPQGMTQAEYLHSKSYQGAKDIYQKITPQIKDRLDYELEIISKMGYEPIFLIVEDVLRHARKLGIPTSSRGSAASSLVAHCLNITSPDPLALNLYFERFLNPARKKPPDIDTDIASHRRDEVIQYVFERYGKDRVAMVGTINRYRPKSALGDVAKAYGLSPDTIRQLSKRLPSSFSFQREEQASDPFAPLLQESSIPIIKKIINDASAILDFPRHLSVHPGGIIIAPFPITDLIPLVHSSTLGINHTQYDLDGVEKFGMVKIDLLGIRGLTVLGEVADRIQSWRSREFSNGLDVLQSIPDKDSLTAETITEAKTIGCFQIESPGMRATLREIQAKSAEDIMAALALYRPGPLRGGLRDAFVRRFRGEEPISYVHPSLSNFLNDTFGVILYQEQVLKIAHELGGLTIAQADILRRAMSHFDPGGMMDTLRKNFIAGAAQNHHVPFEVAERIWEMMAAFAGYGFPKAHAASYAQLAWNSAWCKTHFPAEFISAVLGFHGGYYSQRVYLMEARRLNLQVNPPHINHSNHRFCVKYPQGVPVLYMGLDQVRDLTQRTIERIISQRPYHSLDDFLLRVNPQKKEAENLIMCGALEGLTTIPSGLAKISLKQPPGQLRLFSSSEIQNDWDSEQKIAAQQEILGVNLTDSPLKRFAEAIQSAGALTTLDAQSYIGEKVCVAGMRQTMRRFRTKANQTMCFLNLEDLDGSLQVIISAPLYNQNYAALQEVGPFLILGVMEEDLERGQIRMVAEKITLLK